MSLGKKGMEMWEIVMIVLAIILLLFVIAWFSALSEGAKSLLEKFAGLF